MQAKAELGLKNSQVIHARVEEYKPNTLYDGVISRAFASLADMLYWTEHLLSADGVWWAMKAQKDFEDYSNLPGLVTLQEMIELHVPGLQAQRMLIKAIKPSTNII
nr:RsmG family class I SAM-dependent methyltransferase [Thiomicrorhabdus aquaedulcis]